MEYSVNTGTSDQIQQTASAKLRSVPNLFLILLGFIFRPAGSAFIISFAAFYIFFVSDLFILSIDAGPFPFSALFDMYSLTSIAAFIFSSVFLIVVFVFRVLDGFTHRFGKIWTYGAPGLSVFILFLELPARFYMTANFKPEFYLFVPLLLAAGLFLLFLLPVYSGANASILFLSSLIARILLFPYEPSNLNNSESYASFHFLLLAITSLLYLLIQARYRFELSPYYEPFRAPAGYIIFFSFLLLFSFFMLYAGRIQLENESIFRSVQKFIKKNESFVYAVIFCLFSWILYSISMNLRLIFRKKKGRKIVFGVFLISILLSQIVSIYHLYKSFPDKNNIYLLEEKGTSSEGFLIFFGLFSDNDSDGNTRWPGGDPDDSDSCVRIDYRCRKETEVMEQFQTKQLYDKLDASNNIILVTVPVKNSSNLNYSAISPVNRYERALRALFQNINGMDEFSGIKQRSFVSELAEMGFRTMCGGMDAGKGYMNVKHKYRLDTGCQIFIDPERLKSYEFEKEDGIGSLFSVMASVFRRYSEKKNFLWINFDYAEGQLPDPESLTEVLAKKFSFLHDKQIFILGISPDRYGFLNDSECHKIGLSDLRDCVLNSTGLQVSRRIKLNAPSVFLTENDESHYASWVKKMFHHPVYPEKTMEMNLQGTIVVKDRFKGIRYEKKAE